MRTHTEVIRAAAAQELRSALRGRMVIGFAGLFTLLCLGISLAGLAGSGQLMVQGFTRTGVSILGLSVYLLPLLGLVLGATAFGTEDGGTELVLAQPVGRGEVLVGRTLGLAAALALAAGVGFGAAAAVVGLGAGAAGGLGYLGVAVGATGVGVAGLAVGVLLGIAARRRGAAVGWAMSVWFGAAVLYDLAAIALLQLVGSGEPGGWLVGLLALNPIDGVRSLGLVALGGDVLLGPTGAALREMLGFAGGGGWVLTSLLLWILLPLAGATWIYRRRDF